MSDVTTGLIVLYRSKVFILHVRVFMEQWYKLHTLKTHTVVGPSCFDFLGPPFLTSEYFRFPAHADNCGASIH